MKKEFTTANEKKKVTDVYKILTTLHKLYDTIESLYELLRCQKDYITITNRNFKA